MINPGFEFNCLFHEAYAVLAYHEGVATTPAVPAVGDLGSAMVRAAAEGAHVVVQQAALPRA
jgi:hypothetical protein